MLFYNRRQISKHDKHTKQPRLNNISFLSHARYVFDLSRKNQVPEVFLSKILAPTLKSLGECCDSADSTGCFNAVVLFLHCPYQCWNKSRVGKLIHKMWPNAYVYMAWDKNGLTFLSGLKNIFWTHENFLKLKFQWSWSLIRI